jgi:cell division initiation protein
LRITPLDIHNHIFPRRLHGYDREEVDAFLRMVSGDYETVLGELQQMRDKVSHLEQRMQELLGNERLLQETLTTAQHLSEDLKQTAVKEAEMAIRQAEIQGEKILDAAHRRAARLAEDLREMKLLRGRVAAGLRATLEHHLELVEHLSDDPITEDPELESRIEALAERGNSSGS